MSGMSAGGIGEKWYSLSILGGIRISPARGSEQAIYDKHQREGDEYRRILKPLRDKIEQIVLQAKQKFDAPIVIYDAEKDDGYIDGVIIEDEIEFDLFSINSYLDEKQIKETVTFEQEQYQTKINERAMMTSHFDEYFVQGSHITVSFDRHIPDDARYYQMSFTVNNRIKRSTLNWIRGQIDPLVVDAFQAK